MRADRLVAVLLLLQQRGKVTAAEVAAELEVSERTARRDLDALGMAGLPVYALRGRGGGWRLAGGGSTDLSGLNAAETRALFVLAGPRAATPEVKSALRKLVRALPEPLRDRALAASDRVLVDPSAWDRRAGGRLPEHLDAVERATIDGEQLRIAYVARDGASSDRVVHPLGLASKGSTWYLFAHTDAGQRAFRVDRISAATPLGEPAMRPDDFDLGETWERFIDEVDEMRTPLVATGRAAPDMVPVLRTVLGTRLRVGPPDTESPDGWVDVVLRGHRVESLTGEIAGFAGYLEITDPPEMRDALAAVGDALVAIYASPVTTPGSAAPA
jgi:predicted DNA-binding transcriptional regulator YafY